MTNVQTVCTLDCPCACNLTATVENGRLTGIRPTAGFPYSPCVKGLTLHKAAAHPDRLKYPLMKHGGVWKRVSWSDALDVFADRIEEAVESDGLNSILHFAQFTGSMSFMRNVPDRFFNALGGVTSIGPKGSLCLMAGLEGIRTVVGQYASSHTPEDLANSRFLLAWGHNPKATSPAFYKFARKARQAGARMIVVDPVKSETAIEADGWLPLKPGTDVALALAMLQVIIDRHLHDADLEKYTVGFGKLMEHVQSFTPEHAAEICGVDASLIRDTAADYATVKPAALLAGMGAQHYTWGYDSLRCLAFLAAVTGNLGVSGGGLYYSTGSYFLTYNMEALTLSSVGTSRKEIPPVAVAQHILDAKPTPTRMLLVAGSNPAVQLPNLSKVHAAFDAVGFKVVVDRFMTPTARMANLVLPAASTLEYDDVRSSHGHAYIQMVNKAVDPPGEARTEYEIFGDLAARLGLKQHFSTEYLQIVDEALRPTGLTVNLLKQRGFVKAGIPDIPFQDRRFPTASGKIEFEGDSVKAAGLDPLPRFQLPPEGVYSPLNKRYPLVLITHKGYPLLNSQITSASASKTPSSGPKLLINPADASHRGIVDGEFVKVSNERGRCKVRAEVTPRVREGVVVLPTGWWMAHYAEGAYNFLTSDRYTQPGENAIYNEAVVEVKP